MGRAIEDHNSRDQCVRAWRANNFSKVNLRFESEGVNRIRLTLFGEHVSTLSFYGKNDVVFNKRSAKLKTCNGITYKFNITHAVYSTFFEEVIKKLILEYVAVTYLKSPIVDKQVSQSIINVVCNGTSFFVVPKFHSDASASKRDTKSFKLGSKNSKRDLFLHLDVLLEQYTIHCITQ